MPRRTPTQRLLLAFFADFSGILLFVFRVCCLAPFLLATPVRAQTDDPATGELLENFFRDNEQPAETDVQFLLEYLDDLRQRPLNLNTVGRDELTAIRLLNEIQIENFLAYRNRLGPLLSLHELQAVPAWEVEDIRRILPFVTVSSGLDDRNNSLWQGFWTGDSELLMRWGRPDPVPYPATAEGSPDAMALRYRHSFDNRLRYGFTAESDPGEALFQKSNRHGFDFYSAHLFASNVSHMVKTVALGDYSARLGQGLLLQTGFAPGKSAETTSIARGGRPIRPYAAFGEAFFLRGAAATLSLAPNWEVTALLSHRRRDANVLAPVDSTGQEFPDLVFSSLQTSGLHRTPGEIADEKAVTEWLGGLSLNRMWKNGQVALNGLYTRYDKPWEPNPAPYRRFAFTGDALAGISVDYFWRRRNWYVFGELARSGNFGGMAAVNGVLFSPERRVTLALLHRHLARDYQAIYAAPFAESAGPGNEQGLYAGIDVRFGRRWQVNAYADVWRHPWLRFGVSAPSTGSEYLGRIVWTPKRGVSLYALWQIETKERDSGIAGVTGLLPNTRSRFRLHASYRVGGGLEFRSRVEWSRFKEGDVASSGFLAFQEALVRPMGSPISGSVRFAIFDTQNFDTRVYAFENDLFSAVSIPAFAGRGTRYFVNLSWRVNNWFRLEGRLEQTSQRVAVTDSGLAGGRRFWKLQARFRF